MYDSLLDHDLEDETTVVGDVATDLDDKPLDDDEDETDSLTEPTTMAMRPSRPTARMLDAESLLDAATPNRGPTTRCGCI